MSVPMYRARYIESGLSRRHFDGDEVVVATVEKLRRARVMGARECATAARFRALLQKHAGAVVVVVRVDCPKTRSPG